MDALLPSIGVVVGGLLAGGTTYLLERARERRAARAAALLVCDELKQIWTTLDISVGMMRGEIIGAEGDEWDTSQWQAHRAALAGGAPEVWGTVANAYRRLWFLPKGVQKGSRLAVPGREGARPAARGGRHKPTPSHPLLKITNSRDLFGRRSTGSRRMPACP